MPPLIVRVSSANCVTEINTPLPSEELLNHAVKCRTISRDHSGSFVATSECRAQLTSAIVTSMILKSLISVVCYCLCGTHGEKERDTSARGVTVILLILTPLASFSPLIPSPFPSCALERELLAPIFGFLLSMFFTIRESLLNTSTLKLMCENMLHSAFIGRDAKKAAISSAH